MIITFESSCNTFIREDYLFMTRIMLHICFRALDGVLIIMILYALSSMKLVRIVFNMS
jgi:hypothetical protein